MARRWLGLSSSTQRRSPTPRLSVDCVSIDGNGGAGPCKRYRAIVAYDGTDFLGFQAQDHRGLPVRTVQGALEAAVQRLVGSSSRVLGAGRTDAGVHASGQVIHVDLSVGRFGVHELHRALNAVLPQDIRVLAFEAAPDGFHARFSALSRSYRYLIDNGPQATPSLRRIAWHVSSPLDVDAMNVACQALVGLHDYVAFSVRGGDGPTMRRVLSAQVKIEFVNLTDPGESGNSEIMWHNPVPAVVGGPLRGRLISIEVEANAFLRQMMRRIVGSLVRVGRGWVPPSAVGEVLSRRIKADAGPAAPAHGLDFFRVAYVDANMLGSNGWQRA